MNVFERLLVPFNTRGTSAAGAAGLTLLSGRLFHDVTDIRFVRSLYQAVVLHADPWPFFELAAISAGALLCVFALYIGAPWFVRGDSGPPSPPAAEVPTTLKPAA